MNGSAEDQVGTTPVPPLPREGEPAWLHPPLGAPFPGQPGVRHLVDLHRHATDELREMLARGKALKVAGPSGPKPLAGRTLACIFEKPSTRTRVSFEVAMRQLGGDVTTLTGREIQLGHGETIADTGRVLSRYVDVIMIRTNAAAKLHELASAATVPVINGLTDRSHPCQILADIMTFEEWRGPVEGRTICWSGDANNVCESWIHAAVRFGFALRIACPPDLGPPKETLAWVAASGGDVQVLHDAREAAAGADAIVTDTWVSMHHDDPARRHALLEPYRVDEKLMGLAKRDAIFLHCLPAHRGEEVAAGVIDGPQSAVWDEAENRLHVQKGILTWCLDP